MAKIKVMFVNDKHSPQQVFVNTLANFHLVQPRQGQVFEVEVGENQGSFVKIWEGGQVLLSAYDLPKEGEPL